MNVCAVIIIISIFFCIFSFIEHLITLIFFSISRYDARGYLNDLSQYDSQCKTNSNALDQQEIDFENRLNSERFNDLNYDDDIGNPIIDYVK